MTPRKPHRPVYLMDYELSPRRTLQPGVEFSVSRQGARGRYVYWYASINADGSVSITGYGGRKGAPMFRSFTPEEIRAVHRTRKLRKRSAR